MNKCEEKTYPCSFSAFTELLFLSLCRRFADSIGFELSNILPINVNVTTSNVGKKASSRAIQQCISFMLFKCLISGEKKTVLKKDIL